MSDDATIKPSEGSDVENVIEIAGATRVYHQGDIEVHALRGIDLAIARGEFTALAGPSGSGKTTLLNLIGCLDTPSGGTIHVAGTDVSSLSKAEAASFRLHRIGFVFQSYNLIPVLTALENAEFILLLQGVDAARRREVVMPLLERVGLGDHEDRRPHELSGGQQQRVAIVRALAAQPAIILADEPTANLDSDTSKGLLDMMLELNEERGATFLFSTHDQLVMERARRVVRLDSGKVVADEHDDDA